jgi:hypothetical protein
LADYEPDESYEDFEPQKLTLDKGEGDEDAAEAVGNNNLIEDVSNNLVEVVGNNLIETIGSVVNNNNVLLQDR